MTVGAQGSSAANHREGRIQAQACRLMEALYNLLWLYQFRNRNPANEYMAQHQT